MSISLATLTQFKTEAKAEVEEEENKQQQQHEVSLVPTVGVDKSSRLIFQVDEGHRSQYTANKYRVDFRHFLDFVRIHDLDVLLDLGKEAIQELVIKYTRSLRDNPEKKYSRSTVNNRVSAILYFLDNNDIELNKRKIRRYFPSDESTKDDRPYTIGEMQRIISVCDLRSKAMILLMVSAGLRVGALSGLQKGHLTEMDFQGFKVYKIRVYAGTRYEYFSFCTPECYNAINEYLLNVRQRYGEEIKDKSPLFRKDFNKSDPFRINVPKFLTDGAVMKIVDEVLKKSGVKTSEAMRTHACRKGFKSICEQSGMKSINVELLMGHNIGVSGHYYRPEESDILGNFMTHAADALTIVPTKRLERENTELRKGQQDYLAELGEFKDEFNEIKQWIVELKRGNQKELVNKFYTMTADKVQDEYYESESE